MRVIKKAISKVYEIKCSNCGSILECDEEYDIVWMHGCSGKAAKIYCPVCDEVHVTRWQGRNIKEIITYEDDDYIEDEEFEEEEA